MSEATAPSVLHFNTAYMNEIFKMLFNSRNLKIFREIGTKPSVDKNVLNRVWIAMYIGYEFLRIVQCSFIKILKTTGKKNPLAMSNHIYSYIPFFLLGPVNKL